ncbi:MAG: UMP kinase [Candidatus Bathyarchaeia archaeon]
MRVSISLGGSLLTRDMIADSYRTYADALLELKRMGHKIVVVCGGGRPAREYIRLGRELGASEALQDRLGILATHLNALLMIAALGEEADGRIHRRPSEVNKHLDGKILVGGGYMPGVSTDYRAVQFAGAMNADLIINATDYGGVFDRDPGVSPEAEKFDEMSFEELEEIVLERFEQAPGDYGLFDLKGVRLAERLGIPVIFIDGSDPREIIRAVEGRHSGTVVYSQ